MAISLGIYPIFRQTRMNSGVSKISSESGTVMSQLTVTNGIINPLTEVIYHEILPFISVKGHNCILLSVCTCYVFF